MANTDDGAKAELPQDQRDELRRLPAIEKLLAHEETAPLLSRFGHPFVLEQARLRLAQARRDIIAGATAPSIDDLARELARNATHAVASPLRGVINATGVIIHTNLGRAPLSDEATRQMSLVSAGYSNLELDLESGERGSRHSHLDELLQAVTGAESGIAVNNNASALLLCLSAFAQGGEVIVSRSQAVEIGGGFRVPDVLLQSGARLVEVGTTNRTYLRDYESAKTESTSLLLHVHSSNFRIIGFTHEVSGPELARFGEKLGVPVLDDVGSGALLDTSPYGLDHEPMPRESIEAGATLVCFSGDKLLGGPQAGVIVGKKWAIDRVKRHPLARAFRIDKGSLAGLVATLAHYRAGSAIEQLPVWRMIAQPAESLRLRAESWRERLLAEAGEKGVVIPTRAAVGGGSLPGETLPSFALAIPEAANGRVESVTELARRLRLGKTAVLARIEDGRLILDARTVLPGEDDSLIGALLSAIY